MFQQYCKNKQFFQLFNEYGDNGVIHRLRSNSLTNYDLLNQVIYETPTNIACSAMFTERFQQRLALSVRTAQTREHCTTGSFDMLFYELTLALLLHVSKIMGSIMCLQTEYLYCEVFGFLSYSCKCWDST